jgi:hypothetical protein
MRTLYCLYLPGLWDCMCAPNCCEVKHFADVHDSRYQCLNDNLLNVVVEPVELLFRILKVRVHIFAKRRGLLDKILVVFLSAFREIQDHYIFFYMPKSWFTDYLIKRHCMVWANYCVNWIVKWTEDSLLLKTKSTEFLQDFRIAGQWLWRMLSSGMWRVVLLRTEVSGERIASIIRWKESASFGC